MIEIGGSFMKHIELSIQEYSTLITQKPNFNGREGNLYRVNNCLYKLYHNPYRYPIQRLETIISYQNELQYTTLPIGSIHFLDQFMGPLLKDFPNSYTLAILRKSSPSFKIKKLKELSRNLQEITNLGLILNDLDYENVLLSKEQTIEIIDMDGDNVMLFQTSDQLETLLAQFRTLILECCFFPYHKNQLEKAGLNLSKQETYLENSPSYLLLNEFLDILNTDQIISNYQKSSHL